MTAVPLPAIVAASLVASSSLGICFNPNDDIALMILILKAINPHSFRDHQSPFYVLPRSTDLYENYMMGTWSDEYFRSNFRMNRFSFFNLCERLTPHLQGGQCNYRVPLSVEKKVAIALYRLACEKCEYRILADLFGVGKATACKVFKQFLGAVIMVCACNCPCACCTIGTRFPLNVSPAARGRFTLQHLRLRSP